MCTLCYILIYAGADLSSRASFALLQLTYYSLVTFHFLFFFLLFLLLTSNCISLRYSAWRTPSLQASPTNHLNSRTRPSLQASTKLYHSHSFVLTIYKQKQISFTYRVWKYWIFHFFMGHSATHTNILYTKPKPLLYCERLFS